MEIAIEEKVTNLAILVAKVEERAKSNTTRLNNHDEVLKEHEEELKENSALVNAIEKLAIETKYMREDLNKTVQRLEKLENKDADKWEKFKWALVVAIIGILIAFIAKQIGLK